MIVVLIIALATLENMAPLIIGWLRTPPGMVFLGTVHHPADYFYYLSQFAQGQYRWLTTTDLYTTEAVGVSFIGWFNVLLGRLWGLVGIPPLFAYHLSVFLLTVLLLVTCYKLSRLVLSRPTEPWRSGEARLSATLALYLFTLFHAFPILRDGKPSYGDYWNNFAVPFVRLGSVPHQLFLNIVSMLLVYFTTRWMQFRQWKYLLHLTLSSFVLASLQPALWATTGCTIAIAAILYGMSQRYKVRQLITLCIPILYIVLGGILPAFYLYVHFLTPPFLQLKLWEATQQTLFTPSYFLSATGPIFLLALVSIPAFLSDRSFPKILTFLVALCSMLAFLSPLPMALGLSQVRFMSTLTILCLSIITADGLNTFACCVQKLIDAKGTIFQTTLPAQAGARLPWNMGFLSLCKRAFSEGQRNLYNQKNHSRVGLGKFVPKHRGASFVLCLCAALLPLTLYLLPNHLLSIRLATDARTDNAYYYLPRGDYDLLRTAAKLSTPSNTFLVLWPYDVLFPAVTGRRTYSGHPLLTIHAEAKDTQVNRFFANDLTNHEVTNLLSANHITYLIAYSWTAFPQGLYDIVATGGSLTMYRINQSYLKTYSK